MTAPINYGSVVVMPLGPGQTPDNITALGSATALPLGNLVNSGTVFDFMIPAIQIETGATAGGTVSAYLIVSADGTNYTDSISPTATTNVQSQIVTAYLASTINTPLANTKYKLADFSALGVLQSYGILELPLNVGVIISNGGTVNSALHTGSTNFLASYQPVTWA